MDQSSQKSSLFPWERTIIPSFASLRNQPKSSDGVFAFTPSVVTNAVANGQQKDLCTEVTRNFADSLCYNQLPLSSDNNELQQNNLEATTKSSNTMMAKFLQLDKSWPSTPIATTTTTKNCRNNNKTPLPSSNSNFISSFNSQESIKQSELNRVNRLMRKQNSDKISDTTNTPQSSKSFGTPQKQLHEDTSWSKYLTPIRPPAAPTNETINSNNSINNKENLFASTSKGNDKSCFSIKIDDNYKDVMPALQTLQILNFSSSNTDTNIMTTTLQDQNPKDIERQYEEFVKEKANFEHYKNMELSEIEIKKQQELQIIETEKKKWTKTRTELELAPSQRHIQEVDSLQKQICDLQYTLHHRENIHRIELERLKRRINELSRQNQELLKNQKDGSASYIPSLESSSKSKENYRHFHQKSINNSCEYTETDRSSTSKTVKFNLPPNPGCEKLDKLAEQIENIGTCVEETIKNDEGKLERIYSNGTRLILLSNGVIKEIRGDSIVIVHFENGDIKEIVPHQKITYFYTDGTVHTIFADGEEVVEYCNGQIERTHSDGTAEIQFPDNVVQHIFSNGEAETVLPDQQAII
ncbi:5778_t:CDS:10 [Ambispora gerdemannii]|uniref:5778_t:CDS:1 n=1 Tax=Ambispora gerdemannii TaxID=144530 RepID=A0A9N9DY18_9GLOM|nr:5778_t:CDS:10 [Ambispora gerdemannii]